jgi:hypothetical protein
LQLTSGTVLSHRTFFCVFTHCFSYLRNEWWNHKSILQCTNRTLFFFSSGVHERGIKETNLIFLLCCVGYSMRELFIFFL